MQHKWGEKECMWVIGGKARRKQTTWRRRRVDNTEMDLGEIGCCGVDWICLAQWRALVIVVINLWFP
jgi:hypothetical protein